MATITGRVTAVAASLDEYNALLSQVAATPEHLTLVSRDDPSLTLVVDANF